MAIEQWDCSISLDQVLQIAKLPASSSLKKNPKPDPVQQHYCRWG